MAECSLLRCREREQNALICLAVMAGIPHALIPESQGCWMHACGTPFLFSKSVSAMINMPSSCIYLFFEENILWTTASLIADTDCNDDHVIISISRLV